VHTWWAGARVARLSHPTLAAVLVSMQDHPRFHTLAQPRPTLRKKSLMQALEYLQELIPFSSVSSESNSEITDCVEKWLVTLGFEVERLDYPDERGVTKSCVLGRKGPGTGCGLAYFGHTDVVPVNSWSFAKSGPWVPQIVNGRIYGRGSCDMKGSLACMLAAVEAMRSETLSAPLYFVATADEEIGMDGAKTIVKKSRLYRDIVTSQTRAIIGEPTQLDVVHAHKGGRAIRVTSIGRAAHSSTGLGINANIQLIPFLTEIGRINQELESSPSWNDGRFSPPTPTLNLLIRDTNTGVNITSARSECTLYFRPMPGQDADGMVDRIRQLAHQYGLGFELLFSGSALYTDPQSPFIRDLLELTSQTMSRTVAYGTDGAVLTELKNVAVFGPGDIAQAHTDDEWISLEQLELGTRLYQQCIQRWCC
jgi:acetylornithine deacetylase